jgi:flagellar export protein FliJ
MTGFRFRLDRVLEWRRKEYQIEESRLAACRASLNTLTENIARLQAERLAIGREFAGRSSVLSPDLNTLGPYRLGAKKLELEWNQDRLLRQAAVTTQLAKVQTAQRRVKLLENLRERRKTEFVYAESRELESVAAEAYLSKWSLDAANHRAKDSASTTPVPALKGE